MQHGRAKLTPFGGLPLVERVECLGWSVAQAREASACPGLPPTNGLEGTERRVRQVWTIALPGRRRRPLVLHYCLTAEGWTLDQGVEGLPFPRPGVYIRYWG